MRASVRRSYGRAGEFRQDEDDRIIRVLGRDIFLGDGGSGARRAEGAWERKPTRLTTSTGPRACRAGTERWM